VFCRYSELRKITPMKNPVTPSIRAIPELSVRARQVASGTSGFRATRSIAMKLASRIPAAAKSTSVRVDPQPWVPVPSIP
jgi:hypothetical protein